MHLEAHLEPPGIRDVVQTRERLGALSVAVEAARDRGERLSRLETVWDQDGDTQLLPHTQFCVDAAGTVRNVLEKLTAEYPALKERILDDDGNLQSLINVLINGRSIRYLDGLDTTIKESDQFAIFPPVGGG